MKRDGPAPQTNIFVDGDKAKKKEQRAGHPGLTPVVVRDDATPGRLRK